MPAAKAGKAAKGPIKPIAPVQPDDPKNQLNNFAQRYCKRSVTKEDIVYTAANYDEVYQVTVTMNCMEGQQFVGETASSVKEGEKNAATQALIHFKSIFDSLPPSENKKGKKRKADGGEEPVEKAPKVADPSKDPALTPKALLGNAVLTILRRTLAKGEIVYETLQTPMGFQSTVKLPCLPGEWSDLAWAGRPAETPKQAEHNASEEALNGLNSQKDSIKQLLPEQPAKTPKSRPGKGEKGKGKGGKDSWAVKAVAKDVGKGGGKAKKEKAPLARTRVSEVAVTGDVVKWKDTHGWIKPHAEISHPAAKKRNGEVYLSREDVVGDKEVSVGAMVTFQVYVDSSGLGAEEASAF